MEDKYCIIGLIPFFLTFIQNIYYNLHKNDSILYYGPLIIFVNGFIFYILFDKNEYIKFYDIICNNLLFLYLNVLTIYQPYCLMCTLYIYMLFYLNQNYFKKDNFIHIIGVQLLSTQLYLEYSY